MRKWTREVEAALTKEGLENIQWRTTGSGHKQATASCACGGCVKILTSTSPSDTQRTLRNLIGEVRRQLRKVCHTRYPKGDVHLAATMFACIWHVSGG